MFNFRQFQTNHWSSFAKWHRYMTWIYQGYYASPQSLRVGNMSLCLLIQTWICSSSVLWLCLRPAEIRGTGPPLSHLSGDAVNQNAGRQPGPYSTSEGDPRRQGGHHHHRRQCFCVLSHPQEGQLPNLILHTCTYTRDTRLHVTVVKNMQSNYLTKGLKHLCRLLN